MKIPVVFYQGRSFNLVTFGLFSAIGSIISYLICIYYLYSQGTDIAPISWKIIMVLLFFNLFFAKFYSVFDIGISGYIKNLKKNLNSTSFYQQGGLIGLLLGTILLYFLLDIPIAVLGDAVGFGGIATMAIGRLGCYNYGCCTGKPTKSKIGLKYDDPKARICRDNPDFLHVPLIPVQLFSSAADFLILIICGLVAVYFPYSGLIMIIIFLGINLKRILIQPYRYKNQSNRIHYRIVAFGLIAFFIIISIIFYFLGETFFEYKEPVIPLTPANFFKFLVSDFSILASVIAGGIINFIAYGIHGRKLGTYFNIKS